MKENLPLIFTEQYKQESAKWLGSLSRGESVSVLFFPKADRFIRVGQLLNDPDYIKKYLGKKRRYLLQQINFDPHDAEDRDDLCYQIIENLNMSNLGLKYVSFDEWMRYFQKQKATLVLVLVEAEKFIKPESKHVLALFTDLLVQYSPTLILLSFFETNITHPSVMPVMPTSDILYENIYRYPLYNQKHTEAFIDLLKKQWRIEISNATISQITNSCGGHFWLVKEAVRELVKKQSWSPNDEDMLFRLNLVYQGLLPSEQSLLEKIVTHKANLSQEEKMSFLHLQKMGVIDEKGEIIMHIYEDYILKNLGSKSMIQIDQNRILINQIPIETILSRKEYRVFKALMQKPGKIVSREELARYIWPTDTDTHYSDWAIDQIITRLRKRLVQLTLNPKIIAAIRGKGYLVNI